MFFYFYHSEIFAALYEWLLHYAVNSFCFAFAAGMFRAGALVVLTNYAFIHFDPSIARASFFCWQSCKAFSMSMSSLAAAISAQVIMSANSAANLFLWLWLFSYKYWS